MVAINKNNGSIFIAEANIHIESHLKKNSFLSSERFHALIEERREYKNSHSNYRLKTFAINENDTLGMTIYFDPQGKISMIILYISNKFLSGTWENWSLEKEMQRKRLHDEWLEGFLGKPPYNFEWGRAWSVYDKRSGGSGMGITYK